MNRRALNRRRFLQAVGATALTYPFLRALPSFAQSNSAPRYLILVYTPCGVVRYEWGAVGPARPTSGVGVSPLGAFRATLQPFATGPTAANVAGGGSTDLTSQVTVLDGLNVATANGSHEAGMAALWTGISNSGPGNGVSGLGMSIDQAIAGQLKAPTNFTSIPLMVYSPEAGDFTDREVKTRMLYDATDFVDPVNDPAAAIARYLPTAASAAGADAGPSKQNAIRQVVFNQINTELTTLQTRMCKDDGMQLGSIQEAWNQLSKELTAAQKGTCSGTPPSVPVGTLDFPTKSKLMMDTLALCVACDKSRVLSLQFSTATSNITHKWVNPSDTASHHQHSHSGPSSLYALGPDLYDTKTYNPSGTPNYDSQLAPIDLWYANQVAYLAQRLSSLNVLKQSVICWGSELDMGQAHNHDDTPFLLIGGGGGALKTGNLVQFPLNLANNASNNPPTNNRFHNDLLITLATVMGVPMSTFGSVSGVVNGNTTLKFCTGPIEELLT